MSARRNKTGITPTFDPTDPALMIDMDPGREPPRGKRGETKAHSLWRERVEICRRWRRTAREMRLEKAHAVLAGVTDATPMIDIQRAILAAVTILAEMKLEGR